MSGDLLLLDHPESPGIATGADVHVDVEAKRAGVSVSAVAHDDQSMGTSSSFADYRELTKPRIVTMILIVTSLSAVFYAGTALDLWMLVHLLIGTSAVAASAGVFNQILEQDVDRRMRRTRMRPLADRRVSILGSTFFGATLIVAGSAYLWWSVGLTPAALGILTWLLYVAVYTPMKTRSVWNTTVGAIAGALPMLMGYTAAGGSLVDVDGWLLFGVLLLWQYPHFMAIAWMHRRDYEQAGLQMVSVTDPSGRQAGMQAILGSVFLGVTLVLLVRPADGVGFPWLSALFSVAVLAVTAKFIWTSFQFAKCPEDSSARRLLRASIVQLPAAMMVLVIAALMTR